MRRTTRAVLVFALGAAIVGSSSCTSQWAPEVVPAADDLRTGVREFGIVNDPWQVDDWSDAVGATPTMVMEFEQWHQHRTLDSHFLEARRQGLTSFMVTWEPWQPVAADQGRDALYAEQPAYSNTAIVAGEQDDYVRAFAESVAASGLIVYIRYAHEMNGDWYPWGRDPEQYVLAWRHIVDIFREVGASNARFVFSLNPSLYQADEQWQEVARQYWPGADYVDFLGPTMINFGGEKHYSVAELAERIRLMHDLFGKEVILAELNTAYEGRLRWLTDLRTWLATEAEWVVGVVLSQTESRGQLQLGVGIGDMSWDVTTDPATRPVIRGMVEDLRG